MNSSDHTVAIIVAAGRGTRAGGDLPKQWQMLNGQPVLAHTLAAFAGLPRVLVIHPDDRARAEAIAGDAQIVEGGATRDASVMNALLALEGRGVAHVLIHDGARPLVSAAVINRVRPLHVSFAAPETRLAAIHTARARGPLMAEVSLPGEKTPVARGRVVFMDNAVDPATGTLRMKAEIPNPDARLTPGQFFAVSLRLDTLKNVVTLPAEAVQQGPQGSFVYVVKPDAGVELRKVTLIQARDGLAAIAQGLKEGETVVTDGHSRLTPGSKVKIKTPGQEKK